MERLHRPGAWRTVTWGLVVAALMTGCEGDSAQGGDRQLDAVAERLVSASLLLDAPEAVAGSPTPVANARQAGSNATIVAGGTGVALRSDCLDGARSGGAWPDGAVVAVVESGTERCSGWTRVTRDATTSWVRTEYLVASGNTAPPIAGVGAQDAVAQDIRLQVASLKETVWRVGFLLRRTPGRGPGGMAPTYLASDATRAREIATKAQAMRTDALPKCVPVQSALVGAARDLETLANAAKGYFEAPAPGGTTATARAAETYITQQAVLIAGLNACLANS